MTEDLSPAGLLSLDQRNLYSSHSLHFIYVLLIVSNLQQGVKSLRKEVLQDEKALQSTFFARLVPQTTLLLQIDLYSHCLLSIAANALCPYHR